MTHCHYKIHLIFKGRYINVNLIGFFSTLNYIKPYRSVKQRRYFSVCSFPRQCGKTSLCRKIFYLDIGWFTYLLILDWPNNGIVLGNTHLSNVEKYLNIAILFRVSPRLKKWYRTFNSTHLSHGLRHCFQKWLGGFLKMF